MSRGSSLHALLSPMGKDCSVDLFYCILYSSLSSDGSIAVTICSDFGPQEIKSATVSAVSPSICYEVMGPNAMIFVF